MGTAILEGLRSYSKDEKSDYKKAIVDGFKIEMTGCSEIGEVSFSIK